ncbi:hypothetical protein GA0070621_1030 [Micromonospora narathiwatensis]|uniref:Peptidase family M23 n=1 Tax=Micromonospora narathiwatensis TaxID=299146 RepID=A0A1A8Z9Z7_9ACTN|nr:hypothetical protein GA0070621_1030 [Micromonospora narathiwatensis]
MNGQRAGVGVAVVATLLLVCGLPLASVIAEAPAAACAPAAVPATSSAGTRGGVGRWNSEQVTNAATIVTVGQQRGIPARGWVIAVATAMVESSLRNLQGGDRDSLGLFQQRPSQGWGTPTQILDPVYAAGKFYDKLLRIPDWQQLPLTVAAQRVQVSAFPDKYGEYEQDAEQVVAAVTGIATISDLPGASLAVCSSAPNVAASGWTLPVQALLGSGYGPRAGRLHAGVDLVATRNTVIRAASAGEVVWSGCDPGTGNCDIDGSPMYASATPCKRANRSAWSAPAAIPPARTCTSKRTRRFATGRAATSATPTPPTRCRSCANAVPRSTKAGEARPRTTTPNPTAHTSRG